MWVQDLEIILEISWVEFENAVKCLEEEFITWNCKVEIPNNR